MQRKASAVWQGGLKDGKGSIATDSGVLKQTQYSFSTRFAHGVGRNPETLLGAAHAGWLTIGLDDPSVILARTFSLKCSNRYNAPHDSRSGSVRCRCRDLSNRALGRVRGYHPAAPRHAKIPPRPPFLPFYLDYLEIRDVL